MAAATNGRLVFPRSDGTPDKWPPKKQGDAWFERLEPSQPPSNPSVIPFGRAGVELTIPVNGYTITLPDDYALFSHNKPQAGGGVRDDVYFYGASSVAKFRSPKEFLPHAEWLFDTSRSLDDHTTHSAISKAKKEFGSAAGSPASAKRPSTSAPITVAKRKKPAKEVDEVEEEDQPDTVVQERARDQRSDRRFRKGELVWFRIEDVSPPTGRGLPIITHWPGLVASIEMKTQLVQSGDLAEASSSAAWTMAGGMVPEQLKAAQNRPTVSYLQHSIRPLGMFSPSHQVYRQTSGLLPWAISGELMGGEKGWEAIGREGERVMKEAVKREATAKESRSETGGIGGEELDKRWKKAWGERIKFVDLSTEWDKVVSRMAVAIRTAFGLWWGGERLWLEDMVRLKKYRAELPADVFGSPLEGREKAAVFMKIRLIALEKAPELPDPAVHAWRCLIYGDLFELVESSGQPPTADSATDFQMIRSYKTPKGYEYRQLNSKGSEVTCDIMDVAGRTYPDLLQSSEWLAHPDDKAPAAGKHAPGMTALAIVGLAEGSFSGSKSEKWKEDLYTMVQEASKAVEQEMKGYYGKSLNAAMGLPDPPQSQKLSTKDTGRRLLEGEKQNGNGNGHGTNGAAAQTTSAQTLVNGV
ncbi:hypothetical protein P7C73_g6063, partial [Tremellales sp. Uapishka_1]